MLTNHELVVSALDELNRVEGVGHFITAPEAVKEIRRILKLDEMTVDQLTAVRNSVVMVYSPFTRESIKAENLLKSITGVIDGLLFNKGGRV